MENKDKILICKDCKKEFLFTVGEQEFYAEKGFNEPQRCRECRQIRKRNNNKLPNNVPLSNISE